MMFLKGYGQKMLGAFKGALGRIKKLLRLRTLSALSAEDISEDNALSAAPPLESSTDIPTSEDQNDSSSLNALAMENVTFNFSDSEGKLQTVTNKEKESSLVTTSLAMATELMTVRRLENEDITDKKKWWSYKNPVFLIILCMVTSIICAFGFWIKFLLFNSLPSPVLLSAESKKEALDYEYKWGGEKYIHPFYLSTISFNPPAVGIIFYDVGLKEDITEKALDELPPEVSLAFSCYAPNLETQLKKAKDLDFLTLVSIPLLSHTSTIDLGELTLLGEKTQQNDRNKWLKILNKSQSTPYILFQGGSIFQLSSDNLTPLLRDLKEQKKVILAPPDPLMTKLHLLAKQYRVSTLPISHWVTYTDFCDLESVMENVQDSALKTGYAVVAFPLTNFTLSYIIEWINNQDDDKLAITPLWKIYGRPSIY